VTVPVKDTEHVAIPAASTVISHDSTYIAAPAQAPVAESTPTTTEVPAAIDVCRASYRPVFSSYKNSRLMVEFRSV
jgi:hypothetical protein